VDAVRADNYIGFGEAAVIKLQEGAAVMRGNFDTAFAQPEPLRWDRGFDGIQEVGSMRDVGAFAVEFLAPAGELLG
jgi:hypothetical protein